MFIFRVLIMIVGLVGCFNAFADTGCPIGYGYQPPMVFVGNNLNGATTITGGVTQNGDRITNDARYRTNNFTEIPVEFGKSYTVATNDDAQILLATYDANHNFIERVEVFDNTYSCQNNVKYVIPVLYVNGENNWQYSVSGTEILFLDTSLRRVGVFADVLDYEKGQIIRNVGVKVLDGTEPWRLHSINTHGIANFYTADTITFKQDAGVICSHLEAQTSVIADTKTEGILLASTNTMYVRRYASIISTVADFKFWLAEQYAAGTPVTVYYPLATPVIESFKFSSTMYEFPVIDADCSLCPPNTYKDFVGNEQCTPCPDRLISPSGAISVNECGRILRVGGRFTFMPVGRRTEHGICTMLNGVKYCADLYEKE